MELSPDRPSGRGGALAVATAALDREEVRMTGPLRRAHFRIWMALAFLLYILFTAGLLARRSATPRNPAIHWEQYR